RFIVATLPLLDMHLSLDAGRQPQRTEGLHRQRYAAPRRQGFTQGFGINFEQRRCGGKRSRGFDHAFMLTGNSPRRRKIIAPAPREKTLTDIRTHAPSERRLCALAPNYRLIRVWLLNVAVTKSKQDCCIS